MNKIAPNNSQQEVRIFELEVENDILEQTIDELKSQISGMREHLNQGRYSIGLATGDPSPVDKEQRALYVARVAGFHKEILAPKLKSMISKAHDILADSDNTRENDLSVKGAIFAFWELLRWGEMMQGEFMSNTHPESEFNIYGN